MKVRLRNPDRTLDVDGPLMVTELLEQLDINPVTVLVIDGDELVTARHVLADDAEVEIRSVISGGAGGGGRCTFCKSAPAVIDVARNRARYCPPCFIDHIRTQVRAAIERYSMLSYDDRILVAVSGGKDSLALWDVLLDMGYKVDGLYVGLGIGGYSDRSHDTVAAFAERRGAQLHVVDMADSYGFDIPGSVQHAKQQARGPRRGRKKPAARSACGTCGLSKRYVFNAVALREDYDVMATGHNLDDEASQLLGNVMRWQTPFIARQSPCLPAGEGDAALAKKVKPLYRLGEREMAAYCVIKGLDYVVEECPLVEGNTVLKYKDILNEMERTTPGAKAQFLFSFLDRVRDQHFAEADAGDAVLVPCTRCDMPTTVNRDGSDPVCAFCTTQRRLLPLAEAPA